MPRKLSDYDASLVPMRLREYLASIKSNNSRFEKQCGLYNGFVKDMDTQITFESLSKIATYAPDLDLGWLFSGLGQEHKTPVKTAPSTYDIHHNGQVTINDLAEKLADIKAELAAMREERKTLLSIIENLSKQ